MEDIMGNSNDRNELIELLDRPNVRVLKGEDGKTWTCWDEVDEGKGLGEQGCESTDEVTYDRGFGG